MAQTATIVEVIQRLGTSQGTAAFLALFRSFLRAVVVLCNVNPKLKSSVEKQDLQRMDGGENMRSRRRTHAIPNNHRRGHYFIGRDNTTKPSTSSNFKFTVERAWLHPRVSCRCHI